jgi:hypothetical protein
METVVYSVDSLMTQSWKADMIVLWLFKDEFANRTLTPDILRMVRHGLTVSWAEENLRQYLKLIPALRAFPDDVIITFDDDVFARAERIERIVKSWMRYPNFVHGHRVMLVGLNLDGSILPFIKWKWYVPGRVFRDPSYLLLAEGIGNVLYPPSPFIDTVFDSKLFLDLASTGDDLWFWAMQVLSMRPTKVVPDCDPFPVSLPHPRGSKTLWAVNSRGGNDYQLNLLFRRFNLSAKLLSERRDRAETWYRSFGSPNIQT